MAKEYKTKKPVIITDEEIDNYIKSHPGNLGNIIMDKAVDSGFREGAKWMRNELLSKPKP